MLCKAMYSYQNGLSSAFPKALFGGNEHSDPKIHVELQRTANNQNILGKEPSWRNHPS